MDLSTIEFGSLLTYSPDGMSEDEQIAKTAMQCLKNDSHVLNPPILMSEFVSKKIGEEMTTLPFAHFLKINPILVPIPKSSLMRPGTLWVPQRLAYALFYNASGRAVVEYLKRVNPLRKAATSSASNRPKAAEHYSSLGIQSMHMVDVEPKEILLVDDVVTRGATIVGAANKLHDAFPGARIRAFAAMRTISPPQTFSEIVCPCVGKITLNGQDTYRRP